jgi:hypothetical protein
MNDTKNGQKSFQKGVFICEGEIENHFVQEVFPSYKVVKTPIQTTFYMTFRILLCRLAPTREHWCKSKGKNSPWTGQAAQLQYLSQQSRRISSLFRLKKKDLTQLVSRKKYQPSIGHLLGSRWFSSREKPSSKTTKDSGPDSFRKDSGPDSFRKDSPSPPLDPTEGAEAGLQSSCRLSTKGRRPTKFLSNRFSKKVSHYIRDFLLTISTNGPYRMDNVKGCRKTRTTRLVFLFFFLQVIGAKPLRRAFSWWSDQLAARASRNT